MCLEAPLGKYSLQLSYKTLITALQRIDAHTFARYSCRSNFPLVALCSPWFLCHFSIHTSCAFRCLAFWKFPRYEIHHGIMAKSWSFLNDMCPRRWCQRTSSPTGVVAEVCSSCSVTLLIACGTSELKSKRFSSFYLVWAGAKHQGMTSISPSEAEGRWWWLAA